MHNHLRRLDPVFAAAVSSAGKHGAGNLPDTRTATTRTTLLFSSPAWRFITIYYREMLPRLRWWLLPAILVLWLVRDPVLKLALKPTALAVIVIYAAVTFRSLGNFGRYGDLSCGVYIVHFPILQSLLALGLFPTSGYQGLAVATPLVIFTAFLSWHLVEKRWLQKSSHYVAVAHGA